MQVISDQTMLKFVRVIENSFTRRSFDDFLVEQGLYTYSQIEDELAQLSSKAAVAQTVLTELNRYHSFAQEESCRERLLDFLNRVIQKAPYHRRKELVSALELDGFEISESNNGAIEQLAPQIVEPRVDEGFIIRKLEEHGFETALNALRQMRDNYESNNWEAANAMTRHAFESILLDIAARGSAGQKKPVTDPKDARKWLQDKKFLEHDEAQLMTAFFNYASSDGSHPGMSIDYDARARRLILIALMQFYISKFEHLGPPAE